MASPKKTPCLNCAERHIGCHGDCEDYLAFSKARKEAAHNRIIENIAYEYSGYKRRN